ncbi:MAG: chromosome segregation protein SMC [Rhodospirillales bacterium]|nr:chromosome segregation protein SMC [Rhodospirillales bacterium]
MQFTKLRLTGFKSFVDPTELAIEPGVTGVVGPNGCGKSNLVEGLKWVMGETSAKQMRGSEMDDVIFSGTANRPARNIAEVGLVLDNTDRTAPAQFNDFDDSEVTRKIEREKGSNYKVNAKDVRARDVQLLFADQASGARSTALVSQGHIGRVVSAKPTDRRKLLEEAAGITGLHSRRHEAELRLRGAETNLERLDDIMITLDAQMQSLRKQVRQATRYRNLNDHIRKAEATLFFIRWTDASEEMAKTQRLLEEAERAVGEITGFTTQASTAQVEAASGLPQRRQAEAEAAAALQRLSLARESLAEEESRLEAARQETTTRLHQTQQDMERERSLVNDSKAATTRLEQERSEIAGAGEDHTEALETASQELETARTVFETRDAEASSAMEQLAADEARRGDLVRRHGELETRVGRLREERETLGSHIDALEEAAQNQGELKEATDQLTQASHGLETARAVAMTAETVRVNAMKSLTECQESAREALAVSTRLSAEEKALADLLETGDPDLWPPLVDALNVRSGYEGALGTALGDDLSAATDESAPVHWAGVPAYQSAPTLPAGSSPMSDYVSGSDALIRRLSQVGVVDDSETGRRLAPELKQGQRLVALDGGFWRWDGYTASSDAPAAAAVRLEQRNRLNAVRSELALAKSVANDAEDKQSTAKTGLDQATSQEGGAKDRVREAEVRLTGAQTHHGELRQKTAETDSKLAAQREASTRVLNDLSESEAALGEAAKTMAALPDAAAGREAVTRLRALATDARTVLIGAQSEFDGLQKQAAQRAQRLQVIANELASWTERRTGAEAQLEQLEERYQQLKEEQARLSSQPDAIETQRQELDDRLEAAEEKRKEAADRLVESETKLAEADKALREAEARLAGIREGRVRAQSRVEQSKQALDALMERMTDRLNCGPDALRDIAQLKEDAALPELDGAEKRVERLLRERENMGPVNLRAEAESQELNEQIEGLNLERDDLLKAIDKLRRGINDLNREGRQRLLDSFKEVDKHFQELFVRLFGGGRAHLTLTESDDPLEAGIEIMASPPGKRLQVLSLLSGGEQALTALALLFGVFLTNPAPICVLDEVDAPLDDANVDRFCTMVEEIAKSASTRFVVITHHRMTMARVNRLYGVTMGEQGVSQLVSVDLGQAMELRDIA